MSNPWLKFYPSDWRSDPALRMCSIAARGLWMEMLCVMHENGGALSVNGKGLTPRQLATLAGCPDVDDLLSELEDAGVFSRYEDGTIFSRRMIRDAEKAEQDKANGKKGGNPTIKAGVNPQDKAEVKAQKPEARSQKSEQKAPPSPQGGGAADLFGEIEEAMPRSPTYNQAKAERAFLRMSPTDQKALHSKALAFGRWWIAEQGKRNRSVAESLRFAPPLDKWISEGAWRSFEGDAGVSAAATLPILRQDDPLVPIIEKLRGKPIIFGTKGTTTVTQAELEKARAAA